MAATGAEQHEVVATAEDAGQRIDRLLAARLPAFSRVRLQSLIRSGHVRTQVGQVSDPGRKVEAGTHLQDVERR